MSEHPDVRVATLALAGLTPAFKRLVEHLSTCEGCREALRTVQEQSKAQAEGTGSEYDMVFGRLDRTLAAAELQKVRERTRALRELDTLLAAPAVERERLLNEQPMPLEIARLVLDRARFLAPADPRGARDLVELALRVLDHQQLETQAEERLSHALTARALTLIGMTMAVEGHWTEAVSSFDAAGQALGDCATDEEEASYCALRGWCCQTAGFPIEAAAYLSRAAEVYSREGSDPAATVRAALALGCVALSRGEIETAIAAVAEAVIEAGSNAGEAARARRILAWMLLIDARPEEAEEVLRQGEGLATEALAFYEVIKAYLLVRYGAPEKAKESAARVLFQAGSSIGFGGAILLTAIELETGGKSSLAVGDLAEAFRQAAASPSASPRDREVLEDLAKRIEAQDLDLPKLIEATRILAEGVDREEETAAAWEVH